MLAAVALLAAAPYTIVRDDWGVPKISADSYEAVFEGLGAAQAQDRPQQLNLARHQARGMLAELIGPAGKPSDEEILKFAYTDEELEIQLLKMPTKIRRAFEAFATGVNSVSGYQKPWTSLDSAAIAISMSQQFGAGGAGELRTLALLAYLKSQKAKDSALDVLDDLMWIDDQRSPTTLKPEDDKIAPNPPFFPRPTRKETEAHLAGLPEMSIFELLPAVALVEQEQADLIAQDLSLVHKWGSYAVVVGKERSKTGSPWLLNGPQMGHLDPTVVYEAMLDAPGVQAAGISIPGVPVIVVGHTPNFAWGLTSGVADTQDIFYNKLADDGYQYGDQIRSLETVAFQRKIKGGGEFEVVQQRTHHGPVILNAKSANGVFSQQSSMRGRELEMISGIHQSYSLKSAGQIMSLVQRIPGTFNFFFATTEGDVGWRYLGLAPIRAAGIDPRLPTISSPDTEWRGYIPPQKMPHVVNPKEGLLVNWNNKSAAWWPNQDTPVWGRLFRSTSLENAIPAGKLGRADLERAIWTAARTDEETMSQFQPFIEAALKADASEAAIQARAFDGWTLNGSAPPAIYYETIGQLRNEIFRPHIGGLISPSLFRQAVQPSAILQALSGESSYDWLDGRTADEVTRAAFAAAVKDLNKTSSSPSEWAYKAGSIRYKIQAAVPYIDRGTYIQITELTNPPTAKSVAGPGVSESGKHATSQIDLLKNWMYKPMRRW